MQMKMTCSCIKWLCESCGKFSILWGGGKVMKWCPVLVPVLTQQPGTRDGTISAVEFSNRDIIVCILISTIFEGGFSTTKLGCLSTKIFINRQF